MAPNAKITKACKALKMYGIAEGKVRAVLKDLLKLSDNNWGYIEDENYRVLLDAIFERENTKSTKSTKKEAFSQEKPEEHKSNSIIYSLRTRKEQLSLSDSGSRASPELNQIIISPLVVFDDELNSDDEIPLVHRVRRRKRKLADDVDNEFVEPRIMAGALSPMYQVVNHTGEDCGGEHIANEMIQYDAPLAVIHPAPPQLLCGAGPSNESDSSMEIRNLDPLNAEEKKTDAPSQLDLASSSGGEVKISLICNLPGYRLPSLHAVLKAVEENYLRSYGITDSTFSLSKAMKDVCEGFVSLGTSSTDGDQVKPVDGPSKLDETEISNQLTVADCRSHKKAKFDNSLHFSNGSVNFQNLLEFPPQIPKFQVSNNSIDSKYLGPSGVAGRIDENNTVDICGLIEPCSVEVVQKESISSELPNASYYVDDITRSEESRKISQVNEINSECHPAFNYIPQSIAYRSADVSFTLAHISNDNCCLSCVGDCMSLEVPCNCSSKTEGEFAYTPGGMVKEDFLNKYMLMNVDAGQKLFYCKDCPVQRSKDNRFSRTCNGHIMRKFIKECWHKCACSKNCGNRVVQRGITAKNLQVFMTPQGKGWGLRTLEDLPKGAFICEYVGEIVTSTELNERNKLHAGKNHMYSVLLDADWGSEGVLQDEQALFLDATSFGNIGRFINHRCGDPNMVGIPVEIEKPDHHYYHLAFFTTREVIAYEELTWDSGVNFDDNSHPRKTFQCLCGSKFCRWFSGVNFDDNSHPRKTFQCLCGSKFCRWFKHKKTTRSS